MDGKTLARDAQLTRRQLKLAAQKEFNHAGYFFTDTNKIARRAGYTPASFYRHFKDKTDVFIAVYRDWHHEQMNVLEKTLHEGSDARALSELHQKWRCFRASARVLAISEERVRAYRQTRLAEQIDAILDVRKRLGFPRKKAHEVVTFLIELERLCDAIADGEYRLFGISVETSLHELKTLLGRFLAS